MTARAFAAAGAAVVIAARDGKALGSIANSIESEGGRALALTVDVGDATAVEQLVQQTLNSFGRLDMAFNNAMDGPLPAPLAEIDPADFDRGIRTNLRGTFLGMKYQIRAMLQSGGGAIVNMASLAGLNGIAQFGGLRRRKGGSDRSY
jgi:NAD(P)-dependent dehydrogenase (short-subunit alcohol dehydrogenase family)